MKALSDAAGARERRAQKVVRVLGRLLDDGDVDAFEQELSAHLSHDLLLGMRRQKTLTKGSAEVRKSAAEIASTAVERQLSGEKVAEFKRYLALCLATADAKEVVVRQIGQAVSKMPKLSLRQLLQVATRTAMRAMPMPVPQPQEGPLAERVAQHGSAVHEAAGRANDLWFAVVRAINECSRAVGERDLRRPDATTRAIPPFKAIATLCSQLNALDYALDSASFGDFAVAEHDPEHNAFKLDIVDVRLVLLRTSYIRRRLLMMMAGDLLP